MYAICWLRSGTFKGLSEGGPMFREGGLEGSGGGMVSSTKGYKTIKRVEAASTKQPTPTLRLL